MFFPTHPQTIIILKESPLFQYVKELTQMGIIRFGVKWMDIISIKSQNIIVRANKIKIKVFRLLSFGKYTGCSYLCPRLKTTIRPSPGP